MHFTVVERKKQDWNEDELRSLVRYVALYNEGDCWPTHKKVAFWEDCAKDVAECSGMPLRTGWSLYLARYIAKYCVL